MKAVVYKGKNRVTVQEVGPAVRSVRKGDRVVLECACGFCFNCIRGYTNACLTANPEGMTAGYGYAGMGPTGAARPNTSGFRSPISTA